MLRSAQSSSSAEIHMDLSVLERQRALLQRLYQQQSHSWKNKEKNHLDLYSVADSDHHQSLQTRIHKALQGPEMAAVTNSNSKSDNSSITRAPIPKPVHQCSSREANVSSSIKKRKAKFDTEEEEDKDKGVETEEKSEITSKTERETSCSKESSKVSEVNQKPDYIHVRARRGQATDSHSLAERARREKISKKMKCLQDLVPGCNKVTGKAGMLDEIINYVQSLQKQVEFLSMKLAAINPRLDFSIDNLFAKEIPAYIAGLSAPAAAQFDATNPICFQYNPMQMEASNCGPDIAMDQSQMLPHKAGASSVPIPEVFLDSTFIPQLQQMSDWESDWPSLFNAGFH